MTKKELFTNICLFLYVISINTLILFRVMNVLIIGVFLYDYFVLKKHNIGGTKKKIYCIPAIIFMGFITFSVILNGWNIEDISSLRRLIECFVIGGMLCFLLSEKKRIIVFGSANIIALSIIAIQYIYASMIHMGRVPGLIGGPNLVGVQILMLMSICLVARRYFANFKCLSILNIGTFLLSVVALLMTESRGSWLGFGLALIVAFVVNGRAYLLTVKRYSIIIMCALIIIIGNSNYIISRITHTVNYTENYTVERIYIWQSSLDMFKDNIWSGIGIGGERFRELYDNQYMLSAAKEKHIPHPHNILLFYLSETGILGFVGFFIFFMCPFVYFIKNMLREEAFSVIAKYAFFFLLSFVISQMVDSAFAFTKILRIYLAVLVFFISAFALYKRDCVSVEADRNV